MWVYSLRDKSFSDDFISLFFCYIGCTSTNKFNKQKKQVFFFFFQAFQIESRGKTGQKVVRGSGDLFSDLGELVHRGA